MKNSTSLLSHSYLTFTWPIIYNIFRGIFSLSLSPGCPLISIFLGKVPFLGSRQRRGMTLFISPYFSRETSLMKERIKPSPQSIPHFWNALESLHLGGRWEVGLKLTWGQTRISSSQVFEYFTRILTLALNLARLLESIEDLKSWLVTGTCCFTFALPNLQSDNWRHF